MKQIRTAVCILLTCLMVFLLPACSEESKRLRESIDIATFLDGISRYSKFVEMVNEGIPEDLVLTIYYTSPLNCTRRPTTADDFKNSIFNKKIVIDSEELATNLESLRKINLEILRLYDSGYPTNTRFCYEFTTNEETLLQVVLAAGGNNTVNGIPVEFSSTFYEAVRPFLTEEDRNKYELDGWLVE